MRRTSTSIPVIEIDGKDTFNANGPHVSVESHWNANNRVVFCLPDGKKYTFLANDLTIFGFSQESNLEMASLPMSKIISLF